MAANISVGSSGQSSDEADGGVDGDRLRDARLPRRETQRTDSGRDWRIDARRAFYPSQAHVGSIAFSFRCQAAKSLSGITAGPLLGVFTLGMFFPLANSAVR